MKIHEKNYIHHDLHSGNIFSHHISSSIIGDLGLCQQVIDKCGDEKIARFLYQCKLNAKYCVHDYIQWILFDEFKNIEYLAKGDFAEVHKATWFNGYYEYYKDVDVVLKRKYNNSNNDKISGILNEVS